MANKDNHLPKENQRVVSITDQKPVEQENSNKPKKLYIGLAITVFLILIALIGITISSSHKTRYLADYGITKGDFIDMVSVAYGYPSAKGSYDDTQVQVFFGLVNRACDDLRFDRKIDFQEMINWSDWERLVASAAVLDHCNSQQDKALDWGLTDQDFEKLPLQ